MQRTTPSSISVTPRSSRTFAFALWCFVGLVILGSASRVEAQARYWINGGGGGWGINANWAPGPLPTPGPAPYPNAIGALADFQGGLPAVGNINVTAGGLLGPVVVGRINFEGVGAGFGYALGPAIQLVLDNGGGGAGIRVNPGGAVGDHVIRSQVFLNDSLTVNFSTPNTLTIAGVIADWTGPVPPVNTIVKSITVNSTAPGSALILTGNNTFTGYFSVGTDATLELRGTGTVTGAANAGNSVSAGGNLYLNGIAGNVSITEVDLHVFGLGGTPGTISSGNGNNTLNLTSNLIANVNTLIQTQSGSLTVNAAAIHVNTFMTFDAATGTDMFINAQLMNPGFIMKTGGGRTVLTQDSPGWNGDMQITAGILEIQRPLALGTPSTVAISGGSLHINNTTGVAWSINENNMKIVGAGTAGEGAIYNMAGNNTLFVGGTFDTTGDTTITTENGTTLTIQGPSLNLNGPSGSNTLTLQTLGPLPTSSTLTVDTKITDPGGTADVVKVGDGTAVFNHANGYNGITYVQQGVLVVRNDMSLGSVAGLTQIWAGATLALENNIKTPEDTIEINSHGVAGGHGGIDNYSGTNVIAGSLIVVTGNSTIGATSGRLEIRPVVDLSGGNLTIDTAAGSMVDFQGTIIDSGSTFSVTKNGMGRAFFTGSGSNDYAGDTVINGGMLILAKTGGADAIGTSAGGPPPTVIVNNTGTLLLGGDHQIQDTVRMELNGGRFNTNGFDEKVDTLTLSSNSILDLGFGSSIVNFADSSAITWTGILEIWNWTGLANTGGGLDQVWFGSSTTALTAAQLAQIAFFSDSGATYLGTATWASPMTGEITISAVPEPSTVLVGMLLIAMIGWRERGWILRHRRTPA